MTGEFSVGQEVIWSSQARGWIKTKCGKIAQVVPAGELPDRARFTSLYRSSGVGVPRSEVSYVVHVPNPSVKGKGVFYWPRTAHLIGVDSGHEEAAS